MSKKTEKKQQEMENDRIHEEFTKVMKEAYGLYVQQNVPASEMSEELRQRIRNKERKIRYKKMGRMAAMLTVVLFTGVSFGVWMNADGVYGGKQLSQKVARIISPLEIQDVVDEDGNQYQTATVTNLDDLETIVDFCDILYIPNYIPADYQFVQLEIIKDSDFMQHKYIYENAAQDPLYIYFCFDSSDAAQHIVTGKPYRSPRTGDEMHVNEIKETKEFAVTKITDGYTCIVNGIGNQNMGIRIMENITKF